METTFIPAVSATVATPDPHKHVNYTYGMVLGVDDFTQEFAYLSGRDQWLARDAIGYGTLSGLKVKIENDEKGPRVLVQPGVALSPRGQLIRVTPAQCAYIDPWLAANKDKLDQHIKSPQNEVHLHVVLCYRDCATTMVPVPGEPCRSEEELMAPSRLADDFRLELRFDVPEQQEEDALRAFIERLSQVEITETSATTIDDFVKSMSDPAPPGGLSIPSAQAREYLRAAFRLWVTELRPLRQSNWFREWDPKPKEKEPAREECLLLAELDVPLTEEKKAGDPTRIVVNDKRRPFVVHLGLLQEWLLSGRGHTNTSATGVVTFKTTGGGRFVAQSNFIDPKLGNGPISVQAAFMTGPDAFVFGDVPNLQRVVGTEVKAGGASTTFRIIANAFETPLDSEFSVRWFAYRPDRVVSEAEVVTLEPLPEEPEA